MGAKAGHDFRRRVCPNIEILKQTSAATIKTGHRRWPSHPQPHPSPGTPDFWPSLMNVRCTRHPHKAAPPLLLLVLLPPRKTKLVAVYNGAQCRLQLSDNRREGEPKEECRELPGVAVAAESIRDRTKYPESRRHRQPRCGAAASELIRQAGANDGRSSCSTTSFNNGTNTLCGGPAVNSHASCCCCGLSRKHNNNASFAVCPGALIKPLRR